MLARNDLLIFEVAGRPRTVVSNCKNWKIFKGVFYWNVVPKIRRLFDSIQFDIIIIVKIRTWCCASLTVN